MCGEHSVHTLIGVQRMDDQHRFPLDTHTSEFKDSLARYFRSHGPDCSCHLTHRGFFDNFHEGKPVSYIASLARRKPSEVLAVYTKYFQKVFGDLAYDDYRDLLALRAWMQSLPEDPVLRFFVKEALIAGHKIELISNKGKSGAVHTQTRTVLLDGKPCPVRFFDRSSVTYLVWEHLRENLYLGLIRVQNGKPVEARLIPTKTLENEPRGHGGTRVRVTLGRPYPDSIILAQAA